MLTPAATAARTASEPEWKKVPSPEVLHVVAAAGEGRHADPLRAFAAHLGQPDLVAATVVVEGGHDVAADAEPDQLVVGRPGGDVVRAARAEVRGAGRRRRAA